MKKYQCKRLQKSEIRSLVTTELILRERWETTVLLGGDMKSWAIMMLVASIAIFAFYFANVASGAFFGAVWLQDVGEMLVLVLACALFVISTLLFEAQQRRK